MAKPDRATIDRIIRGLVDRGQIVEAGWMSFKLTTIPENAPANQLEEMRNSFYAGAQHLLGSIMSMFEPGAEPTEKDLRRMTLINEELERFIENFKRAKGLSDHGAQA
jgi:hypothetical protein